MNDLEAQSQRKLQYLEQTARHARAVITHRLSIESELRQEDVEACLKMLIAGFYLKLSEQIGISRAWTQFGEFSQSLHKITWGSLKTDTPANDPDVS